MQEDLLQLLARPAVVQRAAQMQREFMPPVRRDEHADGYEAARLQVEAGPIPDRTPGEAGHGLLQRAQERVRLRRSPGAIDISVAEHLAAIAHTCGEGVGADPLRGRAILHGSGVPSPCDILSVRHSRSPFSDDVPAGARRAMAPTAWRAAPSPPSPR